MAKMQSQSASMILHSNDAILLWGIGCSKLYIHTTLLANVGELGTIVTE